MNPLIGNTGASSEFFPTIVPVDMEGRERLDDKLVVKCLSSFVELEMISQQWDTLLIESETNTVHQLFAWTEVWWQVLSRERELFVLSVWQGEQLVGVAPLMRSTQRKHGRRARILEFIGSGSVNYLDFIVGPKKQQVMESMLDWLVGNRDQWDMLNLLHIPETSTSTVIIQNYFNRLQISTRIVNSGTCPAFICSGDLEADLKITKKKTEQRYHNHYSKSGIFEFKICATIEEVETYLPAMFEQHIARFCHIPRSNKYVDPLQREFRSNGRQRLPVIIPLAVPLQRR